MVIQERSISSAARLLHLSQSAISIQIRGLEDQLRVPLLERSNTGVRPTPYGEIVHSYAQRFLNLKDSLQNELEQLQGQSAVKRIRIGASYTAGSYFLPQLITKFRTAYPHHSVSLKFGDARKTCDFLVDNQICFGITDGPVPSVADEDIRFFQLGTTELCLVASPESEWSDTESISVEQLSSLPLILREPGSGVRNALSKILEGRGFDGPEINVVMECSSDETIKRLVESNSGVTLLPHEVVSRELEAGKLQTIRISDTDMSYPIWVAYRSSQKHTLPVRDFLAFIKGNGGHA
jgi:DNA-binding transcriptional LysR family regulator